MKTVLARLSSYLIVSDFSISSFPMLRELCEKYYCTSNNVTDIHFSLGVLVTICSADTTRRSLKPTTYLPLTMPHGTLFVVRFHFASVRHYKHSPTTYCTRSSFFCFAYFPPAFHYSQSPRAAFLIVKYYGTCNSYVDA